MTQREQKKFRPYLELVERVMGYCRFVYRVKNHDIYQDLYYCLQDEGKGIIKVYRMSGHSIPHLEPEYEIEFTNGADIEMPKLEVGNTCDLEKLIYSYIENHPKLNMVVTESEDIWRIM